jgi:hypothetical protein
MHSTRKVFVVTAHLLNVVPSPVYRRCHKLFNHSTIEEALCGGGPSVWTTFVGEAKHPLEILDRRCRFGAQLQRLVERVCSETWDAFAKS